jgi:hypothetical protein
MTSALFHIRRRSLLRGNLLVLGAFATAFPLSGFPHTRTNPLLALPALLALLGTLDTLRCVQPRWDLYHFGILLLLTMDTLAVALILVFLLFPYLT